MINIRYLFHQTVTWESPKSKETDIQCYRCQKWGHTSRNCNSYYYCVKCDQEHGPDECALIKGDGYVPTCVNCKGTGHTANFKGCPCFQKYKKDRMAQMNSIFERKLQAKPPAYIWDQIKIQYIFQKYTKSLRFCP